MSSTPTVIVKAPTIKVSTIAGRAKCPGRLSTRNASRSFPTSCYAFVVKENMMHRMKSEDIPAFLEEVAATGCNIIGLPGVGYLIGDADLPDDVFEEVMPKLSEITQRYGKRDHLVMAISEYLVSIGRSYPPPGVH